MLNFGDNSGAMAAFIPPSDYSQMLGAVAFFNLKTFKAVATAPFIDIDCRSVIHGCS